MAIEVDLQVIKVKQPLGELYVGSMRSAILWQITRYDMRQIELGEDGIYKTTGIQRRLDERRVSEIATYVETVDAVFPTAVVLAVSAVSFRIIQQDGLCVSVKLSPDETTLDLLGDGRVARVIDGQHRIEGLRRANKTDFDVNVAFLVDADLEDQARVFATVNLAQTKVSKSHVYDLFSFSTSPSPERSAHVTCLALDQTIGSPFHGRIKRLGTATPGRAHEEPLSQATVVEGILRHIVSDKKQLIIDRDIGRRGDRWPAVTDDEARRLVLRKFFVDGRELEMRELLWNYYTAVARRWPIAWQVGGTGMILPRTNGYRALSRFFKDAYNHLSGPGRLVAVEKFFLLFEKCALTDSDFTTERYAPGTSGETRLYHDLSAILG